jgi:hypothetical protein
MIAAPAQTRMNSVFAKRPPPWSAGGRGTRNRCELEHSCSRPASPAGGTPRASESRVSCVPVPRRATRRDRKPPSDEEIEHVLRARAVSDPRAAEILLRWLQRPRTDERIHGVDLDSMSEAQLERLYAGLVRLASLPGDEIQALVESLLREGRRLGSERQRSQSSRVNRKVPVAPLQARDSGAHRIPRRAECSVGVPRTRQLAPQRSRVRDAWATGCSPTTTGTACALARHITRRLTGCVTALAGRRTVGHPLGAATTRLW